MEREDLCYPWTIGTNIVEHQDQTAPGTFGEIKRQGLHQTEGDQVSKRSMAITDSLHRNGAHVVDEEVVLNGDEMN